MALSTRLPLELLQEQWASQINPFLANPVNSMALLKGVVLRSGVNVINHKLGKVQQGWVITDIQGIATIFRSAPFSDLTLTLTSSAAVTVSIGVF